MSSPCTAICSGFCHESGSSWMERTAPDLLEALAHVVDERPQADVTLALFTILTNTVASRTVSESPPDRGVGVPDSELPQRLEHLVEAPPGFGNRGARCAFQLHHELALVHGVMNSASRERTRRGADERREGDGDDGLAVVEDHPISRL